MAIMFRALIIFVLFAPRFSNAVQIVTEGPNVACEEFNLPGELKIYKDPTLFLGNLSLFHRDREAGWDSLMEETPLLTVVSGPIKIMRLAPPRPFKGFGVIARFYELTEPRLKPNLEKKKRKLDPHPMIVPIKVCGEHSYSEALGFILLEDFIEAQKEHREAGVMPPSTLRNSIPVLPRELSTRNYPTQKE